MFGRCAQYDFLAIPRLSTSQPASEQACPSYQLIDARGALEPRGTPLMFQRILTNTINASMHLLTNPAALGQTRPLGPINLGATVIPQGIEKLCARATEAIVSVVLVGNPSRDPVKLCNTGRQENHDYRTTYDRFAAEG
ncbi:uncharacterized protein LMH87_008345 [Akanthomyces muscarius]|uniref:Uncharacterized protein n=1 Tax=Akanthomyces muscarius TaxID=2231603 RepID=A0A9W8QII4_AKAMU|nr:uncharacterized protein LMH87_008345 [Akanthomyces muscarius]KAJ4159444.1 hypothetical protein LMH87_008345 [Akanthomyces muscarius]